MERPEYRTPIYKKAKEILKLVQSIIAFVKDSDLPLADDFDLELMNEKLSEMEENAQEIPMLITEASLPNMPYDFRMENAVFIKSAAHELIETAFYIEEKGFKDIDYLDLLYDEIEALRLIFIQWIKTFELWKYDSEDWGLFEPEGIRRIPESMDGDSHDSDDDLFYDDDDEDDDFDNDEDY
ncbi:MAG: hypothetical protein R2797_06100 [Gelidibacter sp.]